MLPSEPGKLIGRGDVDHVEGFDQIGIETAEQIDPAAVQCAYELGCGQRVGRALAANPPHGLLARRGTHQLLHCRAG